MERERELLEEIFGELKALRPLLIKGIYNDVLNGIISEYQFFKSGGKEGDLNKFRDSASELVEKWLKQSGVEDQSLIIDSLSNQVEEKDKGMKEKDQKIVELEKQLKEKDAQIKKLALVLEQAKRHIDASKDSSTAWREWAEQLADYMVKNYSRIKNNEILLKEYRKQNPPPANS
ncbi:hypothetical protein NYE37_13690 [Thermoactinomyces sp. FSL K6-2592]|jgi:chromosome segregation ATPase|uniref:hypothetical protein n=1 Tax=Thermoactinomyces sp. FSL K6-2592 TaxID=2975347 RepID=UPI0030F93D3D